MKINSNLFLSKISLPSTTTTVVSKKHAIFIVDCSGSMWGELPELRENFKNKIATSMNNGDKISIVYYSSNGDCGFLLRGYQYDQSIDGLKNAQKAIDMLRPRGCTGFVDPLKLVSEYLKTLDGEPLVKTVIFMSDGYENENPKQKVLSATQEMASLIDSAVVIEYGNYANHGLLLEMNETLNGAFVFSKDFSSFNLEVEKIMKNHVSSKKVEITINDASLVYSVNGGIITKYTHNGKHVYSIPESEDCVYAVTGVEKSPNFDYFGCLSLLYMSVLVGDAQTCWDTLGTMGDIALIDQYNNAIGKPKILEFLDTIKSMLDDETQWYAKGKDFNYLPPADAFCVMDLLSVLSEGNNTLDPNDPNFRYKRIGSKSKPKENLLSESFKEKVQNAKTKEEAMELLAQEKNSTPSLEFIQTDVLDARLSNLVLNTSRANTSIRVTYGGHVNIPDNKFGIATIKTFIYRNYTILKDGVLNFSVLPVKLDENTFNVLSSKSIGVSGVYERGKTYLLQLSGLPTINRQSIKSFSLTEFAKLNYDILQYKGAAKVFNYYLKDLYPKKSSQFIELYGEEGEQYLKELGITEYGGFAPKVTIEKGEDFYMSPYVELSFKGETQPTVEKVKEKISNGGKLNVGESSMAPALKEVTDFLISSDYLKSENKDETLKGFLEEKVKSNISEKRKLENKLSRIVTSKLLSKSEWEDVNILSDGAFEWNSLSAKVKEDEEQSFL